MVDSDVFESLKTAIADTFMPNGPAVPAAAQSYAPGDVSIHFFLQLAIILIACRIVGWIGMIASCRKKWMLTSPGA